jgi:hypothetical protein
MIRNEYRLPTSTLSILLSNSRLNRSKFILLSERWLYRRKFVPMVSNREAHLNWKKRVQANNKHTVGTEVW